jgi:hypothetical protein
MFPERVARWVGDRVLTQDLMAEYLEREHLGSRPRDAEVDWAFFPVSTGIADGALSSEFAIESMLRTIESGPELGAPPTRRRELAGNNRDRPPSAEQGRERKHLLALLSATYPDVLFPSRGRLSSGHRSPKAVSTRPRSTGAGPLSTRRRSHSRWAPGTQLLPHRLRSLEAEMGLDALRARLAR